MSQGHGISDAPFLGERGPARDPLVGSVINGKFHILRAIARGGMGRIYYATQAPLDRPVALKVVQADGENEETSNFLKRFLQEASIMAKLQHPNVVTLFDYGRIEDAPDPSGHGEMYFIAMEYLAGETLAARLKKRQVLSTPEVLFLIRQIGRGLREAHTRGVMHRDLKPSNIILVPEGDGGELVKIVDFGIGKLLTAQDVTTDLTHEGMMVGTPRYMAPEQFEGTASPASDIYALGTIAYQGLAGALPFNGATLPEFMVAKFAHAIPPIRQHNPEAYLPEALEALIALMLARDPNQRPNVDEMLGQLTYVEQEVFGLSQSGPRSLARSGPQAHMNMTGPFQPSHVPAAPPSRPSATRLMEPSRVPPTVIAPLPSYGNVTLGQMTPRPMSTSTAPGPRPADGGNKAVLAAVLLVGVVGAGGIGAWAFNKSRTAAAAASSAPSTHTPSPSVSSTAAIPATDPTFSFTIETTPPGATVYEGDAALGQTPLTFPVDRTSVASGPRTFTVKKDGFVSATIVQGTTDDKQAKQIVTLAPEPPTKKPAHVPTNGGRGSSGGNSGRGETDIRLNR